MNFLKNPRLKKAAVVSIAVVILSLLGFAFVQPGNLGISAALVTSGLFLVDFIVLAVLSLIYDKARKSKLYWKDAIIGGLLAAVVLAGLAGGFGATTFTSGLGAVYTFIILLVTLWAGFEIADQVVK